MCVCYKQTIHVFIKVVVMDIRLKTDCVLQVVGPSGSGKTHFVCNLLSRPEIFQEKIKNVYWLQGTDEGEAGETAKCMRKLGRHHRITILHGFVDGWDKLAQKGDAIVIDDLFHESTKEKNFVNLFTKIARHRHVLVIFITQNLFHKGVNNRTQNLNVHYLALFRNPRDRTAIQYLARQVSPDNPKYLTAAFEDATSNKPHSYLFFDFTQNCPDHLRVRTDIFNTVTIYKQAK